MRRRGRIGAMFRDQSDYSQTLESFPKKNNPRIAVYGGKDSDKVAWVAGHRQRCSRSRALTSFASLKFGRCLSANSRLDKAPDLFFRASWTSARLKCTDEGSAPRDWASEKSFSA